MISVRLASKSCTELGPDQPQLVYIIAKLIFTFKKCLDFLKKCLKSQIPGPQLLETLLNALKLKCVNGCLKSFRLDISNEVIKLSMQIGYIRKTSKNQTVKPPKMIKVICNCTVLQYYSTNQYSVLYGTQWYHSSTIIVPPQSSLPLLEFFNS